MNAGTGLLELLSFKVSDHEYSVDIMSVREIRGWTQTTTLPHSPDYVRGVINLRGTVLPVIDLGSRLGLKVSEPDERSVIIVVSIDDRIIGMRVDAVSDILTLEEDQLRTPPIMAGESEKGFIKSLTILDDRMVRVLDLTAVLPGEVEAAA